MINFMTVERRSNIDRAIANLKSLHDGDKGILEVIACGREIVPALRGILFEPERSGLYQTRCLAVEALAALDAHDVLIEFLETDQTINDPIERLGEDAVINAAALAISNARDQYVFQLLLRLARRQCLTGVIGALGGYGKIESIPALIAALEDDGSRLTAEAALKRLGGQAKIALLRTVTLKEPSAERESESSARRRRSALKVLAEIDESPTEWINLRQLVRDKDSKVSAIACEVGLARAPYREQREIVCRLIELLNDADWLLQVEIEQCLAEHYSSARHVIAQYLKENTQDNAYRGSKRQAEATLRRVILRAQSAQ
jgi:HEAT repeat protein